MNFKKFGKKDILFIYEDTLPEFDSDNNIVHSIQFQELSSLTNNLLKEDPDCCLVFFPLKKNRNILYKEIHTIFPHAEFVSYSAENDPEYEVLSHTLNFSLHVYLPMSTSLLEFIYNRNSSMLKKVEKKLSPKHLSEQKFLDLFNEILNIIDLKEDKKTIFKEFALLACRLLESDNFLIYIADKETQNLELVYAIRNIFVENELLVFRFNNVFLDEIFQNGKPFIDNDFTWETESFSEEDRYLIRSILVFPFESRRHPQGLFIAVNKEDQAIFNEDDLQNLNFLSTPFTLIYNSLVYHEQIQKLTITDDLTNLYNFRYLRQCLGFEIKRCLRYKKTLTLLFIDIDNFKDVNDTYGHLVGSAVLHELGQLFNKVVRDTDVLIRYGGDEFVIILPDTPLDGSKVIAERLRERVERFNFNGGRNLQIQLTVSIGIASCPEHSITAEELLQKADTAMYAAKDDSKNNIKIAG